MSPLDWRWLTRWVHRHFAVAGFVLFHRRAAARVVVLVSRGGHCARAANGSLTIMCVAVYRNDQFFLHLARRDAFSVCVDAGPIRGS